MMLYSCFVRTVSCRPDVPMKPVLIFFCLALVCRLTAQKVEPGAISGTTVDNASEKPAEFVALSLKNKADGAVIRKAATDALGSFEFEGVPFGEYVLVYSYV